MPSIGPYALRTVNAGQFGLDGGAMFGIVPKPLWADRIPPDDQNRIPLATRCLLLEGAGRRILIDTGVGDTFSGTKYEDIYAVSRPEGGLSGVLEAQGVAPSDVTDVVLTHLHFDHCGGGTVEGPEGDAKVTFPNATYHVQKAHWEWAMDGNPKEKGSFIDRTFRPLQQSGHLHLIEGAEPLFDGVSVELVDGHTEAQQIVKISGAGDTLVYVADLLPTTHHLAPAWTMAYDVRPLVTMQEKREFLTRAVQAEWNLFFEHDPEVAVANVERTDQGFQAVQARPLGDL